MTRPEAKTPPQAARPLEWGAGRFAYRGEGGKVDAENGEATDLPSALLSRDGAAGYEKRPRRGRRGRVKWCGQGRARLAGAQP